MEKEEKNTGGGSVQQLNELSADRKENLGLDRTLMAAERTLMAWLRTSLSMISFGFTIYKFLQAIQEQNTVSVLSSQTPRNVGLSLIGIGTFALIIACFQHVKYLRKLNLERGSLPWDLALVVSSLIGLLGLLMFWSIVFNSGPFG